MRRNSIGLLTALAAAGMMGSVSRIGGEEVLVIDGGERRRKAAPPELVTGNRDQADLEAIRAAELRRARKVARQAKGFRPTKQPHDAA